MSQETGRQESAALLPPKLKGGSIKGVLVRQRPKGKGNPWWIFINHDGERQAKKIGDKAAAEVVAKEIRERLLKVISRSEHKRKYPPLGNILISGLTGTPKLI